MEGRARRYAGAAAQASPGRTKVWVEPPPKNHQPAAAAAASPGRRVPVVYYLCRSRHLEHPHFIEVPLASPEGLYLRDVINRLNVLRGKGMAAMYSWSCKRSYKNGFVWHDLCEDDLVLPAHGNEYILKGSELLDQSPPDRQHNFTSNSKVEGSLKHPQEESPSSRGTREQCSSSSSPTVAAKEASPPSPLPQPQPSTTLPPSPSASTIRDDEQCRTPCSGSSGNLSPELPTRNAPSSGASSPGLAECRVRKLVGAQDASTQTDDGDRKAHEKETRTAGMSTEDGASDGEVQEGHHKGTQASPKGPEIVQESPPPGSSTTSSGGRIDTLESLIRAEASKRNSFRVLEEEDIFGPYGAKLKPANLLMQLITCGSISVKDHRSFGLIPTYRPRFTQVEFPSPVFSTPVALRHLDHFSAGNPRTVGLRNPEPEYFSGSLLEMKKQEELGKGMSTLKRSSSFDEDRVYKTSDSERDVENFVDSASFKCIPQTIKMISCKQSRSGTIFSPSSDVRNTSSRQECSSRSSPLGSSKSTSKRMTDPTSEKVPSTRVESFHEEKEKVITIEESLLLELGL